LPLPLELPNEPPLRPKLLPEVPLLVHQCLQHRLAAPAASSAAAAIAAAAAATASSEGGNNGGDLFFCFFVLDSGGLSGFTTEVILGLRSSVAVRASKVQNHVLAGIIFLPEYM